MKAFQSLRIVFMGTPEFAVASLEALVDTGCTIVGVITAPDKPAGRGMELQQSAVKKYALSKQLLVLQPEKLKAPEFLAQLKALNADLQIVVAFRMLPELVWNMPPMGTINVHGSLLPKYRGAAPINWAIINGETETGVTIFKLKHEIDTGEVLMQKTIPISNTTTAGELHDTMKAIGAQVLVAAIEAYAEGNVQPIAQENLIDAAPDTIPHAPKIFTETCLIEWNKTTNQ
ncbi:MAG: methionyl-tRNA formyltransferase, partial [Ferruginibacter sp.]